MRKNFTIDISKKHCQAFSIVLALLLRVHTTHTTHASEPRSEHTDQEQTIVKTGCGFIYLN